MISDYPYTEFSSVDELCAMITLRTASWDTCWYRGCVSPGYTLLPSLFREEAVRKREGYLAIEFRRRAHSRLSGMSSLFDWLCAMQHYGLPTRLLDWSESLAVALYFSIGDIDWTSARPTIWVLDPFALSEMSDQGQIVPIPTNDSVTANADIPFRDDWERTMGSVTVLPLPVAPNFLFDRLSAQNGTFSIHGTDERPLDVLLRERMEGALLKFVASSDSLLDIVNSIRLLRPSPDAMFPDIDGMKTYLI